MALDLEEQEQLDEFKVWWDKYGAMATNIVIAALLAFVAWQSYQYFQNKKSVEASDLYQNMLQLEATESAEIKTLSAQLMEGYTGTPYAGRAAVYAAKNSFEGKDNKSAKSQLAWAMGNAKETSVQAIATLSMASLLLEEKKYDDALSVLEEVVDVGYSGLKNMHQGDIYLAQGKDLEAKKAYEKALVTLEANGRLRLLTQQKLESLGG